MADLRFEPNQAAVLIRPLTTAGRQWVVKYIDRNVADDGSISVEFTDAPEIGRAAREDGLTIGELTV